MPKTLDALDSAGVNNYLSEIELIKIVATQINNITAHPPVVNQGADNNLDRSSTVHGAVGGGKDASPAGGKRMKSAAQNRGMFGTRESVYDQVSQIDALTQYTKMSTVSGTHHRILSG